MKNFKHIMVFLFSILLILLTYLIFDILKASQIIQQQKKEINEINIEVNNQKESSKELKKNIDTINKHNLILRSEVEDGGFKKTIHYNPRNVSEPSNATYEQLKYGLRNTKLSKHVNTFLKVEREYGINALMMVGIVANESAWLDSNRAKQQNNVTGYAVYSNSAKGATFSSVEESILKTAETLAIDYLDEQGKHFNGKSTKDVNVMYSSHEDWYNIVNSIAGNIQDDVNNFTNYLYHN